MDAIHCYNELVMTLGLIFIVLRDGHYSEVVLLKKWLLNKASQLNHDICLRENFHGLPPPKSFEGASLLGNIQTD